MANWMIYGANGYTGRISAELAAERGLTPILAGRSADKVRPLAHELGLESRIFSLDVPDDAISALKDVDVVAHMAGPFSATSAPMVDACMATGTHYLDITGEIAVFEACFARNEEARNAGIALIPGVGFDVVPTDRLARMVADELPTATHLEIAFRGVNQPSQGTAKSTVEGLAKSNLARIDGVITEVPQLYQVRDIPFPHGTRRAASIPWGDVSTAYYSTGVPNIVVYMAVPPSMLRGMKMAGVFRPLLGTRPVQGLLKKLVDWTVSGPSSDERESGFSDVWAEVRDDSGNVVSQTLVTPEGYTLTADAAIRAVDKMLAPDAPIGALTPSLAFGKGFVAECDGVTLGEVVRA